MSNFFGVLTSTILLISFILLIATIVAGPGHPGWQEFFGVTSIKFFYMAGIPAILGIIIR